MPRINHFLILKLFVFCFILPCIAFSLSLDSPVYKELREKYLEIDSNYYSEFVFSDYSNDPAQSFVDESKSNLLGSKNNEGGTSGWWTYGANYWCNSSLHNKPALCRLSTGGSAENLAPICGSSVNNDYQTAISDTSKWCHSATPVDWSGSRLWIGLTGIRTTFLSDSMFHFKNKPMNRLCFEVELPASRLAYSYRSNGGTVENDNYLQLVNPSAAHPNLKWSSFLLGTYTSVYKSENIGVRDSPEEGQTFHGGGMHFYHQPSNYGSHPLTKTFAVAESTIVMCFTPTPSGGRTDSKPNYWANPLMSVVPNDSRGQTLAPEYFNYVTRAYLDVGGGAKVTYPITIKFNKVFALYEHNEIFAMDKTGGIMGVDIVKDSTSAYYPFVVYNWAKSDRMYKPTLIMGDLPYGVPTGRETYPLYRVYIDDNKNGILDANETTQIISTVPFLLKANTNLHLIIKHTPKWSDGYNVRIKYDRKLFQAFFTIQEVGRLRMASFGVRTWLGTESELLKKDSILKAIAYPPNSDMLLNAQWNQEKPNNYRLIKNSPDYLNALKKKADTIVVQPPIDTTGNDTIVDPPKGSQNGIIGYPTEFNPDVHGVFRIAPVEDGDKVYILSPYGEKLKSFRASTSGTIEWDGIADNGEKVRSGLYHFLVLTSGGTKKVKGKFLIVR